MLVATALCSLLNSIGCEVVGPVPDGRAAIHTAETEAPDFALLDIRMPVMDGLDAAGLLWRDMGIASAILTAFSDDGCLERARESGVFGYLLKPATADSLRVGMSIAWTRACDASHQSRRITQLETLLHNRRLIEQAKWRLVESRRLTEPQAHAYLQTEARNQRRKLVDIARDVLGHTPETDVAGAVRPSPE